MVTVLLDPNLIKDRRNPRMLSAAKFAERLVVNEKCRLLQATLPGMITHRNYLEYLEMAWNNHQGVVLSPDTIWYTLLCETTAIVAENVDGYRKLFTTAPGKTTIVVLTDRVTDLPLDQIVEQLRARVPNGLAEHFLIEFSTTDDAAREARWAAFADAVSPYYDYETQMCGIPAIRLDGTLEDWLKMRASWNALSNVLITAKAYCARVDEILVKIIEQFHKPDPAFLKGIFLNERCGSGHDHTAAGWFTKLFHVVPAFPDIREFASHVSKVDYTNQETGRKFRMLQGLFGSAPKEDFMVPMFGRLVFERLES